MKSERTVGTKTIIGANGRGGTSSPLGQRYDAILFDLLTALLDSWTVWNEAAGSEEQGRKWRAEYLNCTYGCGAYRPYEMLVRQAAEAVGLDASVALALERNWPRLEPWPDVRPVLSALARTHRLGIVTNCSERQGHIATERVGVPFDAIVTSEAAGFYKPHPRPYQLALERLGLPAGRVLFVAGSAYDLFGTHAVGLDTYWHNRVGLSAPAGAPRPIVKCRTLEELPRLALGVVD